jgi:hypothetical protein
MNIGNMLSETKEAFLERVAIMMIDGGLSEEEAERRAQECIFKGRAIQKELSFAARRDG